MNVDMKIAGTTFHPLPAGRVISVSETFVENNVSCARTTVVLQPEPTNPVDPDAVMVMVPLDDGSAFHIGYVPKAAPEKQMIRQTTLGQMVIKDYGSGLNPSFRLVQIGGE